MLFCSKNRTISSDGFAENSLQQRSLPQIHQRHSLFSHLAVHPLARFSWSREPFIYLSKKCTKLLISGSIAGLFVVSGAVMAQGQVAVITNDTVIESGEEIGATVVLNGDGQYDVYVGITGGYFGGDIYAFAKDGSLVKWDAATGAAPAKFLDNASLSDMSVNERVIRLFPRIPLSEEYKGSYVFLAGLSSPGQLDFPIVDKLTVEVK